MTDRCPRFPRLHGAGATLLVLLACLALPSPGYGIVTLQTLHRFQASSSLPRFPFAGVLLAPDGFLYGTTAGGGRMTTARCTGCAPMAAPSVPSTPSTAAMGPIPPLG